MFVYHDAMNSAAFASSPEIAAGIVYQRIGQYGPETVYGAAFTRWHAERPEDVRIFMTFADIVFGDADATEKQAFFDAHMFKLAIEQVLADSAT